MVALAVTAGIAAFMLRGSVRLRTTTIETLYMVGLFGFGLASLFVLVIVETDLLLRDRVMQRGSLAAAGAVGHSVLLRPALSLDVVCTALDKYAWILAIDEALILQCFFAPIERSAQTPAVGFLLAIMEESRYGLLDGEDVRAFRDASANPLDDGINIVQILLVFGT